MANVLIGNRYVGDDDPGAVGYGYQWQKTNGLIYERNYANTDWVNVYKVAANGGMLPLTGGTMVGAITGNHGLASADSPDFETTATIEGITIATLSDLAALQSSLEDSQAKKLQEQVAGIQAGISVDNVLKIERGTSDPVDRDTPYTIPLPVYADGTTAAESECVWLASIAAVTFPDYTSGTHTKTLYLTEVSNRTYKLYVQDSGDNNNYGTATFEYIIVAQRAGV
jgi:hypothetical protein